MRRLVAICTVALVVGVMGGCGDGDSASQSSSFDAAALVADAGYEEWATLTPGQKAAAAAEFIVVGDPALTQGVKAEDLVASADDVYAEGGLEGGSLEGMLGIAAAYAGIANITDGLPTAPSDPEPVPADDAKGEYDSLCDYLLGEFDGTTTNYRFVAEATLRNTGDVGTVSRVTAIWDQIGTDPVKVTKTVRVAAGGRKRVAFDVPASQDQLSRHQSADAGCRVRVTIRETF